MSDLATRIASARRAARLTQHELGTATDIRSNTISRYECGQVTPSVDALIRIARACDVSVGWLTTGEGEAPEPRAATGTEG